MSKLHVCKVFIGPEGTGGNPLGVFLDGPAVDRGQRQAVAARLGFSETVFVDNVETGELEIYTPTTSLPFAGHPLVGTAWLLASEGVEPPVLRPPAGEVPTWEAAGVRWIRGVPEWTPDFLLSQYATPARVDALEGPPREVELLNAWAWLDKDAGVVRSRVFAPGLGVYEDEATGAAAIRLAHHLGRPLTIVQGVGSMIRARPGSDGTVDIGGAVAVDEIRESG